MEHSVTIAIDVFELLKAIGSNPRVFSDVETAASKAALAIVIAQLKAKSLTLEKIRALAAAIDGMIFALVLESMDDKTVATILGKLDKHNSDRETGSAAWARSRLCALGDGSADPTPAPPKPKPKPKPKPGDGRKTKTKSSTTSEPFWPESMQVERRRKQKGAA